MNFLKKNVFTLSLLLAICLVAMAPDAFAQTVIHTAKSKATDVFKAVKSIIFIVGGFGLVALAFFAIFGKLKWTWFASLAVGLAILAAAGAIIDYATTTEGKGVYYGSNYMGDTLGSSTSGQ